MFQFRSILRFSLLLGLYATLLLFPWKPVQQAYGTAFRKAADVVFVRFWFHSQGQAQFLDARTPDLREQVVARTAGTLNRSFQPLRGDKVLDTLILLKNRSHLGLFGQSLLSVRAVAYWPTAWLVALLLAKSMSWKKRGWSFLWGMLLLHAFLAFRLSVKLLVAGFASTKPYALYQPSEFWQGVLRRADEIFVQDPTVSFVVPMFIWLAVSFSRKEWSALWPATADADDGEQR